MSGLRVQMFGADPLAAAPEVLAATIRLLDAVADETAGPAHGIVWEFGQADLMCDCCGLMVPTALPGWTNDGLYDLCDACSVEGTR